MKRNFINVFALCCCFIFLMGVIADLNGRWTGVLTTPDGNSLDVIYNFKVDGDILTGTAESPAGLATLDSGKVAGNDFSFQVTVDGNSYPHKGKFYNDSCGIDVDFGSQIVHETLVRDTTK